MSLILDFWNWLTYGVHIPLGPSLCFLVGVGIFCYATRRQGELRPPRMPQ